MNKERDKEGIRERDKEERDRDRDSSDDDNEENNNEDIFETLNYSYHNYSKSNSNEEEEKNINEENKENNEILIPLDPIFIENILRDRLKRRTDLINELRKAYLRDVISIKGFLQEMLSHDERKSLYELWKNSLPSIDIRQHLMLYSPHETSLNMLSCDCCGGSIEIVHHESSELEALSKALSHNDKTKHDLKIVIGTKTAQLESLEHKWDVESRKHRDEVYFYSLLYSILLFIILIYLLIF